MSARAEQKQQTRKALLEAAHQLMESGRGFASLSLREVARTAGIVPTGFYRHFDDMDQLGLALVTEVGQTFRQTIRLVRHNEMVMGGLIEASVRIFLEDVTANRAQFLFLAREQYGGSLKVRQALAALREGIVADLSTDLGKMSKWQHLSPASLAIIADLVVKSVFAMLPELIDPPATPLAAHQTPQAKITEQLRFIFMGARHWRGLNH